MLSQLDLCLFFFNLSVVLILIFLFFVLMGIFLYKWFYVLLIRSSTNSNRTIMDKFSYKKNLVNLLFYF